MPDKSDLRKTILEQRKKISQKDALSAAQRIARTFDFLPRVKNYLLYSPIHGEVDTQPLIEKIQRDFKAKIFFPKIDENKKTMTFFEIKAPSELIQGKWAPEPTGKSAAYSGDSSLIVAPGIVFSRLGHRIGYGKGFYDQFLAQHPNIVRVGIAHAFQVLLEDWKAECFDQVMDFVATPAGLFSSPRPKL